MKNEIEDLAFSHLEPQAFKRIATRITAEERKLLPWASRVRERLERELRWRGICATVNWRVKHPYRAYYEAGKNGTEIAHLTDLIAFRVLVPTQDDCYRALAVIHGLWRPSNYNDYIATAKSNGYQSFHTTVFALEGRDAKLHIRTHDMHRVAQHGIAAFWLERAARGEYVDGSSAREMRELVSWVSPIVELDGDLGEDAAAFVSTLEEDYFKDQIAIHTPKGDMLELAEGSTVLDAAYRIHTSIGDHTIGASIQSTDRNGNPRQRFVGPSYVLHRGDVVRVQTAHDAHPDPSWLAIARSNYARVKINRALRLQERQPDAATHDPQEPASVPASGDLYSARPLVHPSGKVARTELGHCCCPCPGDAILGLAQRGNLVTVHRACCRFLKATVVRRRAEGANYPDPIAVSWPQFNVKWYRAPLLISGQDHPGLIQELTHSASQLGLNVAGSNASANKARYRAAISLTVDIPSNIRLDYVIGRLRRVSGILSVWRDTGKGCFENP